MMVFRCSKDSFYRFLSFLINLFVSQCMTDIFCFLYVSFPYMLCYQLHMIFAFCAFRFLRTITANISTAFVFTIAIPICCAIRKHLIFRAKIAVVILVINVFMLSEIAFFCHRALIRKQRFNSI